MFRKANLILTRLEAMQAAINGFERRTASKTEVEALRASVDRFSTRLEESKTSYDQIAHQSEAAHAVAAEVRERLGGVAGDIASSTSEQTSRVLRAVSEGFGKVESGITALPSRGAVDSIESRLDKVDQILDVLKSQSTGIADLLGSICQLVEKVEAVYKDQRAVADDSAQWREQVLVASQKRLIEVKKSLEAVLAEERRLAESVRNVDGALKAAVDTVGNRLVTSLDSYLRDNVTPWATKTCKDLEKLIARLEVRGASPFKTAMAKILDALLQKDNIGGKHTPWEHALKTLEGPEREFGDEALSKLVRKGLVVQKPTGSGAHVSLNKDKLDDIKRVIDGEPL